MTTPSNNLDAALRREKRLEKLERLARMALTDLEEGNHERARLALREALRVDRSPDPLAGNPSPRRDGCVIEFEGECGHYFELKVYQHKGNTFIETDQ